MPRVLITTVPFAQNNRLPIDLLKKANIEYSINPLNKKLTEKELKKLVTDFDAIIAGTELISAEVMDAATNLKMISRVGVGLDSVDLMAAKKRGIKVSYTPEAPAPAVSELTIGLMLSLLRSVHVSNKGLHEGIWRRFFGLRIENIKIGIIGVGRIGLRVLEHTKAFGNPEILANDLYPIDGLEKKFNLYWTSKEKILKEADMLTIHVPLTASTKNMIGKEQLLQMKNDAFIINTARGGIINEQDLFEVLDSGHLGGAAIDVFEVEPYNGPLTKIDRCLLTSHMGSMSNDCREKMEIEAVEEAIRFLKGKKLYNEVPEYEYNAQIRDLE